MTTSFVDRLSDRITRWIGSTASLLIHTLIFIISFASHWLFGWELGFILLVLTTVVSLEAIYLSLLIQRSVNQQAERLEDVEESIDDVEEALDEVEESLSEAEEDIAEIPADTLKHFQRPMEEMLAQMQQLLDEWQELPKRAKKK